MYVGEQRSGWRPGGAHALVPGRSPHEAHRHAYGGPKLTTSQRANAAVEDYWARHSNGRAKDVSVTWVAQALNNATHRPRSEEAWDPSKLAGRVEPGALPGAEPGGEAAIAARVRREGRSANLKLGDEGIGGVRAPSADGAVRDLPEKERPRTRGIVGYAGVLPSPMQRAPPSPASPSADPASLYAINQLDFRRPWTTGLKGYTGHQLPNGPRSDPWNSRALIASPSAAPPQASPPHRSPAQAPLPGANDPFVGFRPGAASLQPTARFAPAAPPAALTPSRLPASAVSSSTEHTADGAAAGADNACAAPGSPHVSQAEAQAGTGNGPGGGVLPAAAAAPGPSDLGTPQRAVQPTTAPASPRRLPHAVVGGGPQEPGTPNAAAARSPLALEGDPRGAYHSRRPHHTRVSDSAALARPGDWWIVQQQQQQQQQNLAQLTQRGGAQLEGGGVRDSRVVTAGVRRPPFALDVGGAGARAGVKGGTLPAWVGGGPDVSVDAGLRGVRYGARSAWG